MKRILILSAVFSLIFPISLWAIFKNIEIPPRLERFIESIQADKTGVTITFKESPRPIALSPQVSGGKLFIPFESDLSRYRGSFEDEKFFKYAFVYYHAEGEEESLYLYIKSLTRATVSFFLTGTHSTGDGGATPFEEEIIVPL